MAEAASVLVAFAGAVAGTVLALTFCGRTSRRLTRVDADQRRKHIPDTVTPKVRRADRDDLGTTEDEGSVQHRTRDDASMHRSKRVDRSSRRPSKIEKLETRDPPSTKRRKVPSRERVSTRERKHGTADGSRRGNSKRGSVMKDPSKAHSPKAGSKPRSPTREPSKREKEKSLTQMLKGQGSKLLMSPKERLFKEEMQSKRSKTLNDDVTQESERASDRERDRRTSKRGMSRELVDDRTQSSRSDRVSRSAVGGLDKPVGRSKERGSKEGSSRRSKIDSSGKSKKSKTDKYEELRQMRKQMRSRNSRSKTEPTEHTQDETNETPFGEKGRKTRKHTADQKKHRSSDDESGKGVKVTSGLDKVKKEGTKTDEGSGRKPQSLKKEKPTEKSSEKKAKKSKRLELKSTTDRSQERKDKEKSKKLDSTKSADLKTAEALKSTEQTPAKAEKREKTKEDAHDIPDSNSTSVSDSRKKKLRKHRSKSASPVRSPSAARSPRQKTGQMPDIQPSDALTRHKRSRRLKTKPPKLIAKDSLDTRNPTNQSLETAMSAAHGGLVPENAKSDKEISDSKKNKSKENRTFTDESEGRSGKKEKSSKSSKKVNPTLQKLLMSPKERSRRGK